MEKKVVAAQPQPTPKNATFRVLVVLLYGTPANHKSWGHPFRGYLLHCEGILPSSLLFNGACGILVKAICTADIFYITSGSESCQLCVARVIQGRHKYTFGKYQ